MNVGDRRGLECAAAHTLGRIGLLVLGIALIGVAARADTSPGLRAGRPAAVVLAVLGDISLAASVVVAIRG